MPGYLAPFYITMLFPQLIGIHKDPFDLASSILEHMISIYVTTVRKKEVLPFGILITNLCMKVRIDLTLSPSTSMMSTMVPINHTSWNRSQDQSTQPLPPQGREPTHQPLLLLTLLARFAAIEQQMLDYLDDIQELKGDNFRTPCHLLSTNWIGIILVRR